MEVPESYRLFNEWIGDVFDGRIRCESKASCLALGDSVFRGDDLAGAIQTMIIDMIDNSPIRKCVFFRVDSFYTVKLPEVTIEDNALCNPGTIRVEDATTKEVLWEAAK